jgi:hypothetical protein
MGRASKIGANIGLLRAGPETARVAASLLAPISRPMAAPAQSRSTDLVSFATSEYQIPNDNLGVKDCLADREAFH